MNVRKYTEIRLKKIRESLQQYGESKDPEVLHQFRVEIKKLKAVYLLMEECDQDFNSKKEFRIHQKIFHQSGKVRDMDIMQGIMKKLKNDPSAYSHTKEKLKKILKFCECIPAYLEQLEKKENRILKTVEVIKKEQVHSYLIKRKEKISKLLNKEDYKSHLHRVRKTCKDIIYLSKPVPSFSPERIADYDQLQKTIGTWHDKKVLTKMMKKQTSLAPIALNGKLNREKDAALEKITVLKNKLNSPK